MESREVDQYRVAESCVPPLAIHFSCGWVPHGVFCSLVAFLRSSQHSSPWRLSLCPEDPTKPWCLTRNCIKFQFPGAPGSVTLIDTFSHFEVHIDAPYEVCFRLCQSIQQTLFLGINKAAKTLGYSQLVPKLAFLCKHDNTQPHLALPSDAFDFWKCEINPETQFGPLTNEHKVWKDPTDLTVQQTISLATGQQPSTYQAQLWQKLQISEPQQPTVGLTTSSVSAATHSTLHQRTSQAISQQYNHQETELGQQLQQLQFSQCQQRTVEETPNSAFGLTADVSSATAVLPTHSPAQHIISLPNTYQAVSSHLWQQPQMATPNKLQQSPGLEETTQSVQHNLPGAKIKSKLSSAEYQTFQSCFAVLCNGISEPGWLASELYSRDMISRDIRQEAELQMLSASTRIRRLLSAVENQIISSPAIKFRDFLDILHNEPSLGHLATKLEETYKAQVPKEDMQLLATSDYEADGGALASEIEAVKLL